MEIEKWAEIGMEFITTYGLKVIGAIAIWIVGSWVIKKIMKGLSTLMAKREYDLGLQKFLVNLLNWVLKILLVITILGNLGVETTSFAAIIAAAGLAIGMALQGSLGNFAGGVLILIFKPFKIGDYIIAQGEAGTVKEIEIFTTKLRTPDNKEIIIPNGSLSNGNITNLSTEDTRRVDFTFGVGYDSDIKQTKEVILSVIESNPKILKDPAPAVNVSELADSSINFFTRVWVNKEDYWDVNFDIIERTKEALDAAGIDIPYPHSVEIHKEA
ncbi:mechanosensitive ion channel family protein [Oceanihabitans sediminis]|uniref:Mechanosensitive ion channel family protein n=1 Tax=Oceanihabitans sediminis TaxID=1812012 RepID=A0A368P680_9FLAO|nr:mechanosensitive ion channel domain-containing protein [Oceanihabitans sediminis]MDX1278681.1 mechanosensitive ion channel [Oceanihabitans sediminis]MDX1772679.1 mechanosensitive ion channel [Oceanihabitans sediminis]RBP34350.1 small conductance mechanosensitive channel [Oceanihabitans sediminis]RCU58028.1 mechanosensitive ion channel family protein [Oceanihabitans sediminis]